MTTVVVLTLPPRGRTPAEILADIAAMPLQGDRTAFSGEDHDQVLYGGQDAR